MSYRDELVRCAACGTQFVYTVREQRRRAEQGLPKDAPTFCAECRGADVRLSQPAEPVEDESKERPETPEPRPSQARTPKKGGRPRAGKPSRGGRASDRRRGGQKGRSRRSEPPRQTEIRVRHLGTVKWFDDDRGFGFIAQEDGEELFVHLTSVLVPGEPPLQQGQQVEYEIARTSRGPQAVDVVPLG